MGRTINEPLAENELAHLRNEFWLNLSGWKKEQKEEAGFDRKLTYEEVKEIMDLVVVAIHFVKIDFNLKPYEYGDIMRAEGDFFREILREAELI
tara:strand:+ start:66 stop:347 length:282 start_codon:yes stop_codon:yes gene_type:complete